ncbi:sulfatase-like hydrolase/transferase [Paenibacillus sp. JTLBN-2024]
MNRNKPNVLLITVDQMRYDCLSIAGHPVVETPNLDELARTGVRFDRAYSATPSCIPARAAIFTGKSSRRATGASGIKTACRGVTTARCRRNLRRPDTTRNASAKCTYTRPET